MLVPYNSCKRFLVERILVDPFWYYRPEPVAFPDKCHDKSNGNKFDSKQAVQMRFNVMSLTRGMHFTYVVMHFFMGNICKHTVAYPSFVIDP